MCPGTETAHALMQLANEEDHAASFMELACLWDTTPKGEPRAKLPIGWNSKKHLKTAVRLYNSAKKLPAARVKVANFNAQKMKLCLRLESKYKVAQSRWLDRDIEVSLQEGAEMDMVAAKIKEAVSLETHAATAAAELRATAPASSRYVITALAREKDEMLEKNKKDKIQATGTGQEYKQNVQQLLDRILGTDDVPPDEEVSEDYPEPDACFGGLYGFEAAWEEVMGKS